MPLIQNIEELSEHIPVNVTFDFDKIKPVLIDVTDDIFKPYCGQKLIGDLVTRVEGQASTSMDTKDQELLKRIRPSLAAIAMTRYIPIGEIQVDNRGITTFATVESRKGAEDGQIVRLRATLLSMGMNSFERLLSFLAENVSDYQDHQQVLDGKQPTILPNAREFSKCYQIFDSHLTYTGLVPLINQIEEDQIKPLLKSHYDAILANNGLSELQKALRRKAQRALAYSVVADAIGLSMAVELSADGLRLNYTAEFGNVKYYKPPGDRLREQVLSQASKKAKELMDQVIRAVTEADGDSDDGLGLVDNSNSKIVML